MLGVERRQGTKPSASYERSVRAHEVWRSHAADAAGGGDIGIVQRRASVESCHGDIANGDLPGCALKDWKDAAAAETRR